MFDTAAVGELLIDFTPHGVSEAGNMLFERNPGGAPANVLAALSKLGAQTAFMGKVGNDQFGRFLVKTLNDINIDTTGMTVSEDVHTTLAFVHLDNNGDRSFSFYRNPGADMTLEKKDISQDIISNTRIFHFGSVSLTDEPSRSATYHALDLARENGAIISYDPNLRPALWKSMGEAAAQIRNGLKYADILKISEEELEFITKEKDLEKGTDILAREGISLIFVTLGPEGTFYRHSGNTGKINTYDVQVVDTTGAGDAFLGGALFKLKEFTIEQIKQLSEDQVREIADFANAVGALTTTKKGAIPAVPSLAEVINCLKNTAAKK